MPSRPVVARPRRIVAFALAAAALVGGLVVAGPASSGATPVQAEGSVALALQTVANLNSPIAMASVPGNDDLIVAERGGRLRLLAIDGESVTTQLLLDISGFTETDGEGGLLGVAVNPAGNRLYVFHTNVKSNLRIAEYQLANAATTPSIVPGTRRVLLGIRHQPFDNHNGGDLAFGPDGRLYIALGDGGGGGDPARTGQNRTQLLGKVLRINPTATATRQYKNPVTNPFVRQAPRRGEIWLYGVRNPWRISFDRQNGDLYVADVGQSAWEEINVLPSTGVGTAGKGVNLGWSRMEGTDVFRGTEPANHTPPTFQYPHSGAGPGQVQGCSVIGGYVYRGAAIPGLAGQYVYGDFCTGIISSITAVGGNLVSSVSNLGIGVAGFSLVSFGQGGDGELYVLQSGGAVSRIVPAGT